MIKTRIANLTSNILNPFWLSLAIILLLSFASAPSTGDAIKWTLITVAFSILPVFLAVVYLLHKGRIDNIFTDVRQQRTQIYLLTGLFAIAGCIVLAFLGAPLILVAGFATALLTIVVFMCINFWWKISLHTALVAASVTVLIMLYGWTATATAVLVPLTVWARVELKRHSLAQTVAGAIVATLLVVAIFYPIALA